MSQIYVPPAFVNPGGFFTFGDPSLTVPVKMAVFNTFFPSSQNTSSSTILTGIDAAKIVSITVNGMWATNGAFMSNQFKWISSYEYDWYMGNGVNPTLFLCLSANNSLSMVSKPCKITVFYTQ